MKVTVALAIHQWEKNRSQRAEKPKPRRRYEGDDYQGEKHPSEVKQTAEERLGGFRHTTVGIKRLVRVDCPHGFGVPQRQATRNKRPQQRQSGFWPKTRDRTEHKQENAVHFRLPHGVFRPLYLVHHGNVDLAIFSGPVERKCPKMGRCPQENEEKQHPGNGRTEVHRVRIRNGVPCRCGPTNERWSGTCDTTNHDVLRVRRFNQME